MMTNTPHLHHKGFLIDHYNVRSMMPKLDSIKLWLEANDFDVATLNETWLSPDIPTSMLELDEYHVLRQDGVTGKKGGALLTLIKKNTNLRLNEHIKNDLVINTKDAEIYITEIKIGHIRKMLIANCYRPPSGKTKDFFDQLGTYLIIYATWTNTRYT